MEAIFAGGCEIECSPSEGQETGSEANSSRGRKLETMHSAADAKCERCEMDGCEITLAKNGSNQSEELAAKVLTNRQREIWDAYRSESSVARASVKLGISYDYAKEAIRACKRALKIPVVKAEPTGVTESYLLDLLKQQEFRCALSGMELTTQTATLDHKHALADGGKHERGNVWFLHKQVNDAKNSMGLEAFLRMCKLVAAIQDLNEM